MTIVNDAKCIWRATPTSDVGIDGQIEHVRKNQATGRIVFVQVKSGPSYFPSSGGSPTFSPSDMHAAYWENAVLPVILILHNPGTDETFWTDARTSLRAHGRGPIPVDKIFDPEGVFEALACDGPLPEQPQSPESLVSEMLRARHPGFGVAIDYFDLFCQGLIDIARGLYFGMDLVDQIAEDKIGIGLGDFYGLGHSEYAFLDSYVAFLLRKDLIRFDFEWFDRLTRVDGLVGWVVAPLTRRGLELCDYIRDLDSPEGGHKRLIQSRSIRMEFGSDYFGSRTAHIERFKMGLVE